VSPVQTIVKDILSKREELSEEQVLALIEEKKKEGRGLLSEEGAARLVAEELLIQTRGTELGRMQVKDLVSGLNDVTISGRVLLTWPPQQFQRKDGTPGRVMRLVLVDKSDRVRCAIWDRHVDVLSRSGDLQGRIIRIGHAYTRQGLSGDTEVHAGERSSIQIDPNDMPTSDLPEFKDLFTPLNALSPGATQVNAVGVVQAVPRHYTFAKEDRTGSVLRTMIGDESGVISVVAWNERAEELREIKNGDILQALNARVKLDNNARLELHVESRSQVQILHSPPVYLKMPVVKAYKIADLTGQSGAVDLTVCVLGKGASQEIKRSTGDTVKVSRLIVGDETGIVSLSLWDDKADLINDLEEGNVVELRGVVPRDRLGEVMLSIGKSGELRKIPTQQFTVKSATRLNALQSNKGLVVVEGEVGDEPLERQVVTEKGETINLASFTLRDNTASSRVTFWRDQVDQVSKLRAGTRVKISGLRVRTGLSGDFELSSIPLTRVEILEESAKERPAWEDIRHIIALQPGLSTWIKGVILEALGVPSLVMVCEDCGTAVKVIENAFTCETCKAQRTGKLAFEGRLRIDDGTGVAEITVSGVDAGNLLPLNADEIKSQMLMKGDHETELSREQISILVGKEIEVYGTASQRDPQSKFDIATKKVFLTNKM
jgi:ssDNA-binding replication factor A large subunit